MIQTVREHPWRTAGVASVIVVAAAAVATLVVRRDDDSVQAQPGSTVTGGHTHPDAATRDSHAGHSGPMPAGAPQPPDGFAPVTLDPSQIAVMGLTTALVEERDFTRKARTVGIVTVDETRTAHVHARVRGWIEGFHVQYVGRQVRKGEPLVSLYSQEVYAAELELVSLLKSPVRSPELLDAARKRLALWEVPRATIERAEQTGEPQRTFPLLSPRSGTVVAKQAFAGQFIDPSIELYTITDLSRVWIIADLYEADVPYVRVGSKAKLLVEGRDQPIDANVAFLNPTIDERTRTRKVRFELHRADVMPGAFVTVELQLDLDRGLGVPESAVIRTGERAIVFVVHGSHVEPREVQLGARVGDYFRVEAGLVAGEPVATGAQFLLDSESRLRATSGAGGGHAGH